MIRKLLGARSVRRAAALLVAGALVACADHMGPVAQDNGAVLVISADLRTLSLLVSRLTVVVTAPDIDPPLAVDIPISGGIANGMLTLTAGSDRVITIHAYDAAGVETHRGADTITVFAGTNAPLNLTLTALTGGVPIVVTIAGLHVAVTPTPDTVVATGLTLQLAAAVTSTGGAAVPGATVSWATLDPAVATVSGSGVVSGTGRGTTQVIASFGGVAGSATLVVLDPADVPPALRPIASGLSSPLFATSPPGDTVRLFVVEQTGRIRIVRRDTLLAASFIDLSSLVSCCGERGLLGLAFHPDYASNGFFFVDYTDASGNTQVVRYHVTANPEVADPASATPVLSQAQPFSNHNGGMLVFGPDHQLYVGLGDGGSSGDPQGNGQNMKTRLGKILRVNVDNAGFAIPAGNPFIGRVDTLPEIWASGVRNPWRFSFDRQTGELYIGDVGQNAHEEVDVQPASGAGGRNYGWVTMEGLFCYPSGNSCNKTGLTLPVIDYPHSEGCSVTGGYVYRGSAVPMLSGLYLYADYCNGWVRSFRYVGGTATEQKEWAPLAGSNVSSFAEDERKELYVIRIAGGVLQRIVPSRR